MKKKHARPTEEALPSAAGTSEQPPRLPAPAGETSALRQELEALRLENQALVQNQQRLETVLNSITEAFFVLDRSWRILDFNAVAERDFFHRSRSELVGKIFWEEFPGAVGNEYDRQYHRAFATNRPVHFEGLSGLVPKWYEVHAYPRGDRLDIYLHEISIRKHAEAQLRQSNALLEAIYKANPGGLAVVSGPDLVFISCNPTYRGFTPHPEVDPVGRRYDEIWTEEDDLKHADGLEDALIHARAIPLQTQRRAAEDGSERSFTFQASPIKWEAQPALLLVMREVTDLEEARRKAEESAAWAELSAVTADSQREELEAVINSMSEAVAIFDASGRVVRINPAAERYKIFFQQRALGHSKDSLKQATTPAAHHTLYLDGNPVPPEKQPSMRALAGEVVSGMDLRLINSQGQIFEITVSASPIYRGDDVTGAVLVWHDVSERERLLGRIEAEQARLSAIFENAPEGILVTDETGRVLARNPAAELLDPHLYVSGLYMHGPDGQPVPPDQTPLTRSAVFGEVHRNVEMQLHLPDDQPRWLLVNTAPILERGARTGAVGILQDITDLKRAEDNAHFLAQLGERLVAMTDPQAMAYMTLRELAGYLRVDTCLLEEFKPEQDRLDVISVYTTGGNTLPITFRISDLPAELVSEMKAGRTVSIDNVQDDLRLTSQQTAGYLGLGIKAVAVAPRLRDNQLAAGLLLGCDRPRQWRDDELALLDSAFDLVWLSIEIGELLQDLKASQQRFDLALKNSPITVYTTDSQQRFTWIYNPRFGRSPEDYLGRTDLEMLPGQSDEIIALKNRVLETGIGLQREVQVEMEGVTYIFNMAIEPLLDDLGQVTGLAVASTEVTGQRRLEAQVQENVDLVEIQRQIMLLRERERTQIARDIHDGPLQELISVNFMLAEALTLTRKSDRLNKMAAVQAAIHEQIRDLRNFCGELRPPTLAHFGLEKAIKSHSESFHEKHPELSIALDLEPDGSILSETARQALFGIYKELLNNVVKHAGADEVCIRLRLGGGQICLEIEDNGEGFEVPAHWVDLARSGHLGLVGVQERAELLGGSVSLHSAPGKGTIARVSAPLPADGRLGQAE